MPRAADERPCPICGEAFARPYQTCSRSCGAMLARLNRRATSPEHRGWMKRMWIKQEALKEFPRGLVRTIPTPRGAMYLLMQKER